jgi:hypothetical protein
MAKTHASVAGQNDQPQTPEEIAAKNELDCYRNIVELVKAIAQKKREIELFERQLAMYVR